MTYELLINSIEQVLNNEFINLQNKPSMIRTLIAQFRQQQGYKTIKEIVAEYYGILPSAMDKRTRSYKIVEPRQVTMYFYRKYTNLSLEEIGGLFKFENGEVLNHCTALHAINKVQGRAEVEKSFKSKINDIELLLNKLKQVA